MMRILVLEDDRNRTEWFQKRFRKFSGDLMVDYVEDAASAIDLLSTQIYEEMFLDHDLGGETYVDVYDKNTGSEVARFIAAGEHKQSLAVRIVCHSLNPAGRTYMFLTLHEAGYTNVEEIPFIQLKNL